MARPKGSFVTPRYCLHKSSGHAYVTIDGKQRWLGEHSSAASRAAYDRLIAEWLARGRSLQPVAIAGESHVGLTITTLIAAFWEHAKLAYPPPRPTKAGKCPAGELGNFWTVLRPLRRLYGDTLADSFGPLKLQALREELVKLGWSRKVVNRQIGRVRAVFAWGVAQDMVPGNVIHSLQAVRGLRAGRTTARECDPVKPVPADILELTMPKLSRHVRAMVETQLFTGMRPGELVRMRIREIDRSSPVWTYQPARHKTQHHGHQRVIKIGPRAQSVLAPFLDGRPDDAFVFDPRQAEAERRTAQHASRKTPLSCGNRPGTNRVQRRARPIGEAYDVASYRRAIARACELAIVPIWSPHKLRHSTATMLRKQFGLDAARTVLGHRSAAITEVYAEMDQSQAEQVMLKVG